MQHAEKAVGLIPIRCPPRPRNTITWRVCALLLFLCELRVPWILEQPSSSLFEHMAPFQYLAKRFKIHREPCR